MSHLIEIKDVYKIYNPGENEVRALDGVSLTVDRGEFIAIVGQSGSGKSTLMNMLGLLDVCTSGSYMLDGVDVSTMKDDELSSIRNEEIGFIFQGFNLIPSLTAQANVELPLVYRGVKAAQRKELSTSALKRVGLEKRMKHVPAQMSGGEQQRVAIARAMAPRPEIIFADEPTAELDSTTGLSVVKLFKEIIAKENLTVVMTTHDPKMFEICDYLYTLKDGEIVERTD